MRISILAPLISGTLATASLRSDLAARNAFTTLNFDDATTNPLVAVSPVNGNGIYKGYKFAGFSIGNVTSLPTDGITPISLPGVPPHSPPKYISYSATNVQTIANGGLPAVLSSNTAGKKINIQSFYYGFITSSKAPAAGLPAQGNVVVTCNKANGPTQSFTFPVQTGQLTAPQLKATTNGFTGCSSVSFNLDGGLTGVAITALIDDIVISTS